MKWIAGAETDLKTELRNLRDEFSQAIRSDSTGRVQELSNIYVRFIENFLTEISILTDGSASIQAREQNRGYWPELEWISRDLLSLQEQVVKTDNIEMIRNTIYIPIKFARRAVKHHDHELFQQSLRSIPHLYVVAERTDMQHHIKQMLIGRCCMYIQELWRLDIGYGLKKSGISDVDVESHYRFALHLLFVFQELLRYSCQRRDIESFKKFLKQLSEFPDWVYSNNMSVQGDGKVRWLEGELEDKKKQMLFGLTAYVMSHLDSEQGEAEQKLYDFYDVLSDTLSQELNLLWNIKELTAIYVDYRQSDAGYYWGVDLWDIPDDYDVHVVQFSTEINQLYVVFALNRLKKSPNDIIERLELPLSKTLSLLAGDNGSLSETLNAIENSPDKWKHLLDDDAIEKIPVFRELLNKAAMGYEQQQNQKRADKDISPQKVDEFKEEFITAFHEKTLMFGLFDHFERLKKRRKSQNQEMTDRFGFNLLVDKAIFLSDWDKHIHNPGRQYGRRIASGLDHAIMRALEKCSEKRNVEELKKCLGSIRKNHKAVLICSDDEIFRKIIWDDITPASFPGAERLNIPFFSGWVNMESKKYPIFKISGSDFPKGLFLIKRAKFCDLIIENPHLKKDEQEKQAKIFHMNFSEIQHSSQLMKDLIKNPPKWLTKRGDEDAQREYLRGRVQMEIFLRYHLEWDDNAEILHFTMPEVPEMP